MYILIKAQYFEIDLIDFVYFIDFFFQRNYCLKKDISYK